MSRAKGCGSSTQIWSWTWSLFWQVSTALLFSLQTLRIVLKYNEIFSQILQPTPCEIYCEKYPWINRVKACNTGWQLIFFIVFYIHNKNLSAVERFPVNESINSFSCFSHGEPPHPCWQGGTKENFRLAGGKMAKNLCGKLNGLTGRS